MTSIVPLDLPSPKKIEKSESNSELEKDLKESENIEKNKSEEPIRKISSTDIAKSSS